MTSDGKSSQLPWPCPLPVPLEVPMQGLEEAPQIFDAAAAAEDLRGEVGILGSCQGFTVVDLWKMDDLIWDLWGI